MDNPITEAANRISQLLVDRMGVKGRSLAAQARKAQRRLPRKVRKDLQKVITAADRAAHPKLGRQVETEPVLKAAKSVEAYLRTIDPIEALKDKVLWMLGKVSFVLIVLFIAVIYLLWSRGTI